MTHNSDMGYKGPPPGKRRGLRNPVAEAPVSAFQYPQKRGAKPRGRPREKLCSNGSARNKPVYTLHGRRAKKEIPVGTLATKESLSTSWTSTVRFHAYLDWIYGKRFPNELL